MQTVKEASPSSTSPQNIDQSLSLPCGAVIANRLCKSAMTEGLSGVDGVPGEQMQTLYRRWSEGGTGLLVTGNVMVDKRYLERVGNAILEDDKHLDAFKKVAEAATSAGNHCWTQINHPGRQCTRLVSAQPIAPSAEQLNLLWFFSKPREMNEDDIQDVIKRYVRTAELSKQAGFTGVQFHAAHGYLLSQFLSPLTNKRQDQWGGSLENRARLLLTIVKQAREVLGADFPIGVKLNSKDFQSGGFSLEDCTQVASWLSEAGIDLLEISGGSYASMAFFNGNGVENQDSNVEKAQSTIKREAYFLKYAEAISKATQAPLMVTGGFRHRQGIEDALAENQVQMIGLARPFCSDPDLSKKLIDGNIQELPSYEDNLAIFSKTSSVSSFRGLNNQAEAGWYYQQIINLSKQQQPNNDLSPRSALFNHLGRDIKENIKRKFSKD